MSSNVLGRLLRKRLAPYFSNAEAMRFDVVKGEVTGEGLEFRQEVFSFLPSNIVVKTACCSSVKLRVPYTRLDHEPISVQIEFLDLVLQESEKPVHRGKANLFDFTKKKEKKMPKKVEMMLDGFSCQIQGVRIRFELLSRGSEDQRPFMQISIEQIVMHSTNSQKKKLADLAKMRTKVSETNELLTFKTLTIESITCAVFHPRHLFAGKHGGVGAALLLDRFNPFPFFHFATPVRFWR